VLFLLLNIQTIITPIEYAVNIVMTLFIVLEIIIGYFAIRTMVNYQVTKFHVQQFTDLKHERTDDEAVLLEPYVHPGGYYNEAHRD